MTQDEPSVAVVVVDDDPMVRAGLTLMLDGAAGLRVVGQAADGSEVPQVVARHRPDVVLMDLRMPEVDGVTATARMQGTPGAPPVVVLTTFDADDDVAGALAAGAAGFLLKDTPPADLVDAIHRAAAGQAVLSPRVARRLMDSTAASARSRRRALLELSRLTDRELEVVTALAGGGSNADVASALHLSEATVKTHVSAAMARLGVGNRTRLAVLAHEAGLA